MNTSPTLLEIYTLITKATKEQKAFIAEHEANAEKTDLSSVDVATIPRKVLMVGTWERDAVAIPNPIDLLPFSVEMISFETSTEEGNPKKMFALVPAYFEGDLEAQEVNPAVFDRAMEVLVEASQEQDFSLKVLSGFYESERYRVLNNSLISID